MRHSTITLTMDTYGHLFPGSEFDAVAQMRDMFTGPSEALRATGTDDVAVQDIENQRSAWRSAQGAKRCVDNATGCDEGTKPTAQKKTPKPLQLAHLGDDVRSDAKRNENRPGEIRTPDQGIMSPLL